VGQIKPPNWARSEYRNHATAPEHVLAYIQLGRRYVATRNIGRGKAAYLHFFALWKDADPDIPVLKEAKAEYAKLQ
jgi:hypothetical protein